MVFSIRSIAEFVYGPREISESLVFNESLREHLAESVVDGHRNGYRPTSETRARARARVQVTRGEFKRVPRSCTVHLAVGPTGIGGRTAEFWARLDLRVSIMHRDETWTGALSAPFDGLMERLVFM